MAEVLDRGSYGAYSVRLIRRGSNSSDIYLRASLPENFQIHASSEYGMPFEGTSLIPGFAHGLAQSFGYAVTTQASSIQIWQGTSPIEFDVPFIFLASSDADRDVMEPVRQLLRMVWPSASVPGQDPDVTDVFGINDTIRNASGFLRDVTGNDGALSFSGGRLSGLSTFLRSPGPKLSYGGGDDDASVSNFERSLEQVARNASADPVDSPDDPDDPDNPDGAGGGGDRPGFLQRFVTAGATVAGQLFGVLDRIVIEDNISLMLGGGDGGGPFFYFPSVVITSVSQDYQVKLDVHNKRPISVQVSVSFRTFVTPKAEDITNIMPSSQYVPDRDLASVL